MVCERRYKYMAVRVIIGRDYCIFVSWLSVIGRGGRVENASAEPAEMRFLRHMAGSVSYTHLDVYKRQVFIPVSTTATGKWPADIQKHFFQFCV